MGQAGNQLGAELWSLLAAQPGSSISGGLHGWAGTCEDSEGEFFRLTPQGKRQARCLLVDTEPKVVSGREW